MKRRDFLADTSPAVGSSICRYERKPVCGDNMERKKIVSGTKWEPLVGYIFVAAALGGFATAPFLSWVRSLYLHTPVLLKGPMGWSQLVIHMFCVGLPITLVVRRYANGKS
jgi:hypothetical protein